MKVSRPALRKTVRWYIDHQPWWKAILERGHGLDRLGLTNSDPSTKEWNPPKFNPPAEFSRSA